MYNYRAQGMVDYTVSVGKGYPYPNDGSSPINVLLFSVGSADNVCRNKGNIGEMILLGE